MGLLSFLTDKKNSDKVITGTGRNYTDIEEYTVALKVWFPEVVRVALNEMCDLSNQSISKLIRKTLFVYLYGSYDHMGTTETLLYQFKDKDKGNERLAFSRDLSENNRTPELGKNSSSVKVWVAKQMKTDLQKLADKSGVKLSVFVREILVSNLFGHTYLPERDQMLEFRITIE